MPLTSGSRGLAVPDLHLVNYSAKAKWINQIVEKGKQLPWIKYARYYIGTALSTITPEWQWLRDLRQPHADPSRNPPWYAMIQETARKLCSLMTSDTGRS